MGTQPLPMKTSDTGSPPPNSATTSGSTSTPNSLGGMSSGEAQLKHSEAGADFQSAPTQQGGGGGGGSSSGGGGGSGGGEAWPIGVSDGVMGQRYQPPPTNAPGAQPDAGRYNPAAYPSAIKLLVSNNVAGSIIGRSGQTISELQTQSSARIKLSQAGDFYPGTQDRVCLVQGQLENVKVAARLLLERLYMLQEQQHSQHVAWQPKQDEAAPAKFDFVVRLLVPSSSCGMIIGKAGSNIKHMEETSGVSSVRLSPKENADPSSPSAAVMSGTSERVVTLTGPTMENCLKCLYLVLEGMMTHHEISRYSNMTTSYSRVVVPGSFGQLPPTGRPVLVVPSVANPEGSMWDTAGPYGQFVAKRSSSSPDLSGQMIWDQRGAPRMATDTTGAPLSRHVPREPVQQYSPVFTDGPPSFSHEMPLMHSPARGPPNANAPPLYLVPSPNGNQMEQASLSNSASAPDLLALQLQDTLRVSNTQTSNPVEYSHFAPQLPQPTPPGFTAQVLVPDTLIGSILGRGGRTLNELQVHSNTRIRISQRGEYVPGTRNRIVTIRGPTAHSVSLAQYMMSQRMVLPPTASYSPQAPFHPPPIHQRQHQPNQPGNVHQQHQLQQQQQPPPHHHQQQHQEMHPAAYQSPHESAFQPAETHGGQPAPSAAAAAALTPTRSGSSNQELAPP